MYRLIIIAVALLLAGCEDQEVKRKRNEDRLPLGCKIIDMDYGDLTVAVVCDKAKTKTTVRSWDETVMQTQYVNGSVMITPVVYHYAAITAIIEVE